MDPDYDDDIFDEDYEEEFNDEDGIDFAIPGGRSALRAETPDNPRNRPCPTCGRKDQLTPKDVALGYQCDTCADQDEGGF
jgi:hypothetical protein